MRLHHAWVDLVLVLAVLAGAGLLFLGASSLPPPRFEPMGSAALPRILGGLLVLFALIIAIKAILQLRKSADNGDSASPTANATADTETGTEPESTEPVLTGQLRGAVVFASLILYIAALDILQWPFIPVTAVFVSIVGTTLSQQRRQALWKFALFGLLLAACLYLVMTRFLYVDLG
ncbi:tripartite tricarboxylate transporter TctB family protein [Granulosicoccus sp. 3-233]|uniref:tripartite tricarboxylate transporter TctB family protein n=1 Tax=Granulosicoccus sp. 3-233 TaxID=3417969 RepID=UPI003D355C80